jgi:hypothetical protein
MQKVHRVRGQVLVVLLTQSKWTQTLPSHTDKPAAPWLLQLVAKTSERQQQPLIPIPCLY